MAGAMSWHCDGNGTICWRTSLHQGSAMTATSLDSFKSRKTLKVGARTYAYFSLKAAEKNGLTGISSLPYSLKVLLENLLRHEDGRSVTRESIANFAHWLTNRGKADNEIAYRPARGLMQAFPGGARCLSLPAPACRRSRICPPCAMRSAISAAILRRSIRWHRSISSSTIR